MQKHWQKNTQGNYTLLIDNEAAATMQISPSTRRAQAKSGETEFEIAQEGFWSSTITIYGKHQRALGKIYTEKWYANTLTLLFNNKKYTLVIRNNHLAEWALIDNGVELLVYSLKAENGRAIVSITTNKQTDILFDFVLWYLFLPIAMENIAEYAI